MKQLKNEFTGIGQVKGFKFTKINSTDCGFLYEINTGDTKYYEVFRKLVNRRFNTISYPTNKAFGIWAFTTPCLNRANEILNSFKLNAKDE